MYSQQRLEELFNELDAACQNYHRFIRTEPLKPGDQIIPTDFAELSSAHDRLQKAEHALHKYLSQFINDKGRIDFSLDQR